MERFYFFMERFLIDHGTSVDSPASFWKCTASIRDPTAAFFKLTATFHTGAPHNKVHGVAAICPYWGSETPILGRSNPHAGENKDGTIIPYLRTAGSWCLAGVSRFFIFPRACRSGRARFHRLGHGSCALQSRAEALFCRLLPGKSGYWRKLAPQNKSTPAWRPLDVPDARR